MSTPTIQFAGNELPLREHIGPSGSASWVLAPKKQSTGSGFRGFRFARTTPDDPAAAVFTGDEEVIVLLTPGVTASGNRKVSGSATVTVGGQAKTLQVQLSNTGADDWWVIVKAIPKAGGSTSVATASDF